MYLLIELFPPLLSEKFLKFDFKILPDLYIQYKRIGLTEIGDTQTNHLVRITKVKVWIFILE